MKPKVLFYVQHLLGTGHYVRTLAIAHALLKQNCEVHLVSGGQALPNLPHDPSLNIHQLPPCRAEDITFKTLVDENGQPLTDTWWAKRRKILFELFLQLKPDAFVTELFPFGRRAFRSEITPLLEYIKDHLPQTRTLCSIRDILNMNKAPSRTSEITEIINTNYDLVLVHGDESFIGLEETFLGTSTISDKILYTGYVTDERRYTNTPSTQPEDIIVSAGGGSVGMRLCRIAIEAATLSPKKRRWRIITGLNFPMDDFEALSKKAPEHVILERYTQNLPSLLKACKISISQAGYNTVTELLENRTKAILVPFSSGTETEQTLRAQLMEKAGIALYIPPHKLTPQNLLEALESIERMTYPKNFSVDLNGAYRSARLIMAEAEIAAYQRIAS